MITVMEWHDVRAKYLECVAEGAYKGQPNFTGPMDWKINEGWYGGSIEESVGWVNNGFFSPLFSTYSIPTTPRRRNRCVWSEDEGDVDIGRLLSGADDYYLTKGEREVKPGLSININMSFNCMVDAETTAEYGAWCASLIGALEANGHDLEVTIDSRSDGLWSNSGNQTTRIIVKRSNTLSDFTSWSALFSPTGHRHLMFVALVKTAEQNGKKVAPHLGHPKGNGFQVTRQGHIISIDCSSFGNPDVSVPEDLTKSAKECGLI